MDGADGALGHCCVEPTLEDVDVQDPQPDGAHNAEPMAAHQLCMLGAEASSRKPWTKAYCGMRVVVKTTEKFKKKIRGRRAWTASPPK